MDAVMVHVKAAHLAVQRLGRGMLRPFGMTPARFDLMLALGQKGMKQSDLWRRLGVVRSVVCEMVRALQQLAWVKRVRAVDGRTWLVQLTRRGREIFERAYACCVENGNVGADVDAALAEQHVQLDAQKKREELIFGCMTLEEGFRTRPAFDGPDLYGWHPEDYYFWLTEPGEPESEIPFVT